MALNYNKEEYKFVFEEFFNPYAILNPDIKDTVRMLFVNEKQFLSIEGDANSDYSGFNDNANLQEMQVRILPKNADKVWTEASIEWLKIIPIGQKDDISIKAAGMIFPKKLAEILKEETYTPIVKRALIGIKEADETVRKVFPGYCLTETEIK